MIVFEDRNVNYLYSTALMMLGARHTFTSTREPYASKRDSRNGPVLEYNQPVTSIYIKPMERVLFSPMRDANPFFHLHESLWMLAGRSDLESLGDYKHLLEKYSDDGETLWGAYGQRWRYFAEEDQLQAIIRILKNNPDDRRAVLQMWNPYIDLARDGKDVPCNTAAYFKVRDGKLNMMVTCRSNDLIWGCYGANAVHFSMLQEYLAAHIGVEVGVYHQVSDSLHVYLDEYEKRKKDWNREDPYTEGRVKPFPINTDCDMIDWDRDLNTYIQNLGPDIQYITEFFQHVAEPMRQAYHAWKHSKNYIEAFDHVMQVKAEDWQVAGRQWLERRQPQNHHRVETRIDKDGSMTSTFNA